MLKLGQGSTHIVKIIRDRRNERTNLRPAGPLPHEVHKRNKKIGLFRCSDPHIVSLDRVHHFPFDKANWRIDPHPPVRTVPQWHQLDCSAISQVLGLEV